MNKLIEKKSSLIEIKKMNVAECQLCGNIMGLDEYNGICPRCGTWGNIMRNKVSDEFNKFQERLWDMMCEKYRECIENKCVPQYYFMSEEFKKEASLEVDALTNRIKEIEFNGKGENEDEKRDKTQGN